ncbi:MAG: CinA family protein [Planctomycetes bacterium]|nr:CinA family protein [Planctomycetota bacterium]
MIKDIARWLIKEGLTVSVAESCTGGLICHKLTQVPGISAVFKEGIICYSNSSKTKRLGIPASLIKSKGAVSPEVCRLMAINVTKGEKTDIGLAITGIAGPSGEAAAESRPYRRGGTIQKPVGLVYIGVYHRGRVVVKKYKFSGSRSVIKQKAADTALRMLLSCVRRPGRNI